MSDPQGRTPAEVARDLKHGNMIRKLWKLEMMKQRGATLGEIYRSMAPARVIIDRLYGPNAPVQNDHG